MSRSFFSASSALLLDRIFRAGMGLLVSIAIARHYGPAEFGQLSYVLLAASLFGALATLGLDEIGPRDMAAMHADHPSRADMLQTILRIRLFGGLIAYILLLGFIYLDAGTGSIWWIAIILGLYLPLQSADAYDYCFRVEKKFNYIACTRSISALISSALKMVAILLGWPIYAIAGAMTGEYAFSGAIFTFLNKSKLKISGKFNSLYAVQLIRRSWKIMLAGIVVAFQVRVEYYLIEKYLGWDSVGQYAAALKIFETLDVIPIIFTVVLMPELAIYIRSGVKQKFAESYQGSYLAGILIYLFMIPIMLVIIWIFPIAFGDKYIAAQELLPFLLIRPLFVMISVIRGVFVVLDHRYFYPIVSSILGLIVTIVIASMLIPLYGLYGAIAANLLGLFSSTILCDLFFYRESSYALLTCWKQFGAVIGRLVLTSANRQ